GPGPPAATRAPRARLAARTPAAAPGAPRSTARAGGAAPPPPAPNLAAAPGWPDARRRLAAFLTGRLAEVAGACILPSDAEERQAVPARRAGPATGAVAAAIEFAGAGAIRYALARLPPGAPAQADPRHSAARHPSLP